MFEKLGLSFEQFIMSCWTFMRSCYSSIVNSFATNFADTSGIAKFSLKIDCTERKLTLTFCTSSLIGNTTVLHDQSPNFVNNLTISAY